MNEKYKCPSYYDDENVLQDCTCGKCGTPDKVEEIAIKIANAIDTKGTDEACEVIVELLTKHHQELMRGVVERLEELNKCWCGGGRHFVKSYVVVHRSDCALNNRGYRDALTEAQTIIKSLSE